VADVKTLVIRTAGTNCDGEMVRAFEQAGSVVDLVHVERLIGEPSSIDQYDIIGIPGGFSYGDDIASGRVFAMKCRMHLYPSLRRAAMRGAPIIGVCNGFQVLVQLGLLPGPGVADDLRTWAKESPPEQYAALAENIDARFIDDWVRVEIDKASPCVWTRRLVEPGSDDDWTSSVMRLPVASGEGRFVPATGEIARRLVDRHLACLYYVDNVNGSAQDIAGICDSTGLIFGLMPHPDRYLDWSNHPFWTRLTPQLGHGDTPGLRIFRNAVDHVMQKAATPSA